MRRRIEKPGMTGMSPNRLICGPFWILSENLSTKAVKKQVWVDDIYPRTIERKVK